MRTKSALLAAVLVLGQATAADYVPGADGWESIAPENAGFDPGRLAAAVDYAREQAVTQPVDLARAITGHFGSEPGFRLLGPTRPRGEDSGMILRHGYRVASWGEVDRPDMTFSVTKSYLSTMAALALADGLIGSLDEPVRQRVPIEAFEGPRHGRITWRHLLNQTSDWSGELWGIQDWADRPLGDDPSARELHEPGTHYKYNDVRVNLLALALTELFRRPLPVVLRERIMDPIGASRSWRWHGYDNSWVVIDGLQVQSVSGGGHFGGGLFISTADHARFGLLFLRRGRWGQRQLFPQDWVDALREPTPARPDYGYLWWLNTGLQQVPAAPESAYAATGFGGNYIYVDEENDLVVVLRWIPDLAGVIERVLAALDPGADGNP